MVVQYDNLEEPSKCIVTLYREYNRHCPKDRPDGAFYLKPLSKPNGDCWFSTQPVGHNTLTNTVKTLCQQAGVDGHYTNHSLRATAATRLFEAKVDEQLIMQRTGHSTTAGVRSYKRIGEKLKTVTSDVLNRCQEGSISKVAFSRKEESVSTMKFSKSVSGSGAFSPVFRLDNASNVNITFNMPKC